MKITIKDNYRVEIIPIGQEVTFITRTPERVEQLYKDVCKEMVEQVKRHIDNVADINMAFDITYYCSHCGREWDEDEKGVPACCDAAIQEFETSKEVVK